MAVIKKAIDEEDWDTFESEFAMMIDEANAYHEKYDKGFLRWKMPEEPPERPRPLRHLTTREHANRRGPRQRTGVSTAHANPIDASSLPR